MPAFYDAAARDTCGRLLPKRRDRRADAGPLPRIMAAYRMRGTPTLLLIDREGRLRHYHLGQVDNIALGAQIAMQAAGSMRALRFGGEGGSAGGIDGDCGAKVAPDSWQPSQVVRPAGLIHACATFN